VIAPRSASTLLSRTSCRPLAPRKSHPDTLDHRHGSLSRRHSASRARRVHCRFGAIGSHTGFRCFFSRRSANRVGRCVRWTAQIFQWIEPASRPLKRARCVWAAAMLQAAGPVGAASLLHHASPSSRPYRSGIISFPWRSFTPTLSAARDTRKRLNPMPDECWQGRRPVVPASKKILSPAVGRGATRPAAPTHVGQSPRMLQVVTLPRFGESGGAESTAIYCSMPVSPRWPPTEPCSALARVCFSRPRRKARPRLLVAGSIPRCGGDPSNLLLPGAPIAMLLSPAKLLALPAARTASLPLHSEWRTRRTGRRRLLEDAAAGGSIPTASCTSR
jgi:hypothetical protein